MTREPAARTYLRRPSMPSQSGTASSGDRGWPEHQCVPAGRSLCGRPLDGRLAGQTSERNANLGVNCCPTGCGVPDGSQRLPMSILDDVDEIGALYSNSEACGSSAME